MSKATVTKVCPTCGREFKWSTTFFSRLEANSWEAWAEGQERECCECYAETMRRKREAQAAATLDDAQENPFGIKIEDLPMPGTPKQSAWARKIAAEFIVYFSRRKPTEKGIKFIADALRTATAPELIEHRSSAVVWLKAAINRANHNRIAKNA